MPRRICVGQIIRHPCDKTAVVRVEQRQRHPLYNKMIVRSKNYVAHDPENSYSEGVWVRIRESRPLSKTKRWVIIGNADDSLSVDE